MRHLNIKRCCPLLAEEFEGMTLHTQEIEDIPSIFYAQVLRGSTTIPITIRFWSLASIVLQQVLTQLDPYCTGLLLRVARFLPPGADGKLHYLREAIIQGTAPWEEDTTQNAILLGAESLAGQALTEVHLIVINSCDDDCLLPTTLREHEISMLAFPIKRGNRVAGAFLVSSTQEKYFTPARLSLIHRYTDLLTLSFESEDFYEPDMLDLAVMPGLPEQQRQLLTFRQRVAALLKQAACEQQSLNTIQAEIQIWQQFAEEFRLQTS
jgi:hypothetical protein